jgi:hypothetical protein
MDKFLNFNGILAGTKNLYYVSLDGGEIFLLYKDGAELQISQDSYPATAEDKAQIDAALVKIWSKGYTDSVIDVSLSSNVNEIIPN